MDSVHSCRDRFGFAPTYRNFNHGSFGAVPKDVSAVATAYRNEYQARPDRFMRETVKNELVPRSINRLTKYLRAGPEEVVMVESASFSVNSLLRSFMHHINRETGTDDVYIVITDTAYMMVKNCLRYLQDNFSRLKLVQVNIAPPIVSSSDVCDPVVSRRHSLPSSLVRFSGP